MTPEEIAAAKERASEQLKRKTNGNGHAGTANGAGGSTAGATASTGPASAAKPVQQIVLDPKDPITIARTFVGSFPDLILQHHLEEWRRWTGSHYQIVAEDSVKAKLWKFMENCLRMVRKGGQWVTEPFKPTAAQVSGVMDALRAVVHLPPSVVAPCWRPANSQMPPAAELIACRNGLYHPRTQTLHQHTRAFFNVNATDFDFDPTATCPRWLHFLRQLWPDPGDHDTIETLQELFGYYLTHDTRQHKIAMLFGPPRGGKGTIGRVLTALLGSTNICSPTLSSLSQNFGPCQLIDKQVAIIADARLSGRQDSQVVAERLLSISGEDLQTIDRKFREPWTGRLAVRFLILTNELPRIADTSSALSSRFIILASSQSWLGREDEKLTDRLLLELPGILNWALEGLARLTKRGASYNPSLASSWPRTWPPYQRRWQCSSRTCTSATPPARSSAAPCSPAGNPGASCRTGIGLGPFRHSAPR